MEVVVPGNDEQNITAVEGVPASRFRRLFLVIVGLGVLYLAGLAIYTFTTRVDPHEALARFLKIPAEFRIDNLTMNRGLLGSADVASADIQVPVGVSPQKFIDRINAANGLSLHTMTGQTTAKTWNEALGPWVGFHNGHNINLSLDPAGRVAYLAVTNAGVMTISPPVAMPMVKSATGAPPAHFSGSALAYPPTAYGTRSSTGSPGPGRPKIAHTGP